jgi:hypothetical protein
MAASTYQDESLERYLKAVKKQSGDEEREREERRLSNPIEFANWWQLRARRLSFMDVTSATNTRTLIAAITPPYPSGNKVPLLLLGGSQTAHLTLSLLLDSFPLDYVMRRRLSGLSVNYFILAEAPLPVASRAMTLWTVQTALALGAPSVAFADVWRPRAELRRNPWRSYWALTASERLRWRCIADAIVALHFGADSQALGEILAGCDLTNQAEVADPKGFWRVDKDGAPELRLTVLTQVAFSDLQEKIRACGGETEKGIEAFLHQSDGNGWILPNELRLADYGLGHGDNRGDPQPVASRLGPRFYDWQLTQTAEESWRECEIHAQNLGTGIAPADRLQPAPKSRHRGAQAQAKLAILEEDGDD